MFWSIHDKKTSKKVCICRPVIVLVQVHVNVRNLVHAVWYSKFGNILTNKTNPSGNFMVGLVKGDKDLLSKSFNACFMGISMVWIIFILEVKRLTKITVHRGSVVTIRFSGHWSFRPITNCPCQNRPMTISAHTISAHNDDIIADMLLSYGLMKFNLFLGRSV